MSRTCTTRHSAPRQLSFTREMNVRENPQNRQSSIRRTTDIQLFALVLTSAPSIRIMTVVASWNWSIHIVYLLMELVSVRWWQILGGVSSWIHPSIRTHIHMHVCVYTQTHTSTSRECVLPSQGIVYWFSINKFKMKIIIIKTNTIE